MRSWISRVFSIVAVAAVSYVASPLLRSVEIQSKGTKNGLSVPDFACDVADPIREPGGSDCYTKYALRHPESYAWRLFTFMNRQAANGTAGQPDLTKASWTEHDDDRPVVWESWALASGGDATDTTIVDDLSEVFLLPATDPGPWGKWKTRTSATANSNLPIKILGDGLTSPTRDSAAAVLNLGTEMRPIPPRTNPANNTEVRVNRDAYTFIRKQHLYSQEGIRRKVLAAKHAGSPSFAEFSRGSKEVKAAWLHLTMCDEQESSPACVTQKSRYHWRYVQNGGKQVWGLAALHIITKDLTNWFWADFIHTDCDTGTGVCSVLGPIQPTYIKFGNPYSGPTPTKWDNYILRGTEIRFPDSDGVPTLFNPAIEGGLGKGSACMTCHAYASASSQEVKVKQAVAHPNLGDLFESGPPRECVYHANCKTPSESGDTNRNRTFIGSDFVWTIIFRAQRESTRPENALSKYRKREK